ncbi:MULTISPECIES: serine hydrolase domain-containing protein [unclassified Leucobacter]|uniref:serine hydrolase domain-containing protein n=1 Tax=unclassified Leucobacter TaxID=2621730 RepID=UPI000A07D6DD|nr:serine hydrolase domain-containing protein [Leucobacter sp. Ag1]
MPRTSHRADAGPSHRTDDRADAGPSDRISHRTRALRDHLAARLPELLAEHGVPGASLAVAIGDETITVAAGVLNLRTGVPVTSDAVFQIGSVTKVLTATLAMRLADEGRLDLDATVRSILPEFALADAAAAERITVRQLLCHSSGFEGDVFTDTGENDDCLERYVAELATTPQLFAPGTMFSYNNAGICVLGRIIEVIEGVPFDRALRERLLDPLGLDRAAGDAGDAILQAAAVGHVREDPDAPLAPTRTWAMARSNSPAGSRLAMRAEDLIAFARLHLAGGRAVPGEELLGASAIREMQHPQILLPEIAQGTAWGLGWEMWQRDGGWVIGHDGSTIGQSALLRLVPARGIAVAVLTNGGDAKPVFAEIADRVLEEFAGIAPAEPPRPAADPANDPAPLPADPERFTGRYASSTAITEVRIDVDGRLWLERVPVGIVAELGDLPYRSELVGWRGDALLPVEPEGGVHQPVAFLAPDARGRAGILHTGRADVRVDA